MAKTVVLDFDGVIHSYTSGWKGVDVIPDPPVDGIQEAIKEIRKYYKVVVVSTRCFQEGGLEAVRNWLDKYGITVDEVLAHKPPAIVYVDDRALTFDGDAPGLLRKIRRFKTWQGR
ncbi:hypothetical protein [Sporomusa acidovorans]|uniref:Polynucleotide kinase n=1 Tax=Sporomusa acidovorans (strain ATCC 49682 / DSM 3132 / Mol) TaxID=1123286 RepID=A0ABZ3J037_SPOA4|nr:hypothetical protein [Sporomusa acidovorans]OZC19180.1 hypothetical protein SPACI_32660 [Sporomusa acidovorans DSM 3132]SDF11553.1 hypothetical protein SAMN04488499_103338 [Sporomusa acidovorans]